MFRELNMCFREAGAMFPFRDQSILSIEAELKCMVRQETIFHDVSLTQCCLPVTFSLNYVAILLNKMFCLTCCVR